MLDEFGRRVRAARLAAGLTLEDVAAIVGTDYRQVMHVEAGRKNCYLSTAVAIANAVGASMDGLMKKE